METQYVKTSTKSGSETWVELGSGAMTYPGAGIALSTGSSWGTSITNNSANWNTAYGWGDHAGLYDATGTASGLVSTHESTYNHANYNTAYTHSQVVTGNPHAISFSDLTSTPTTFAGYTLTDTMNGFDMACTNGNFSFTGHTHLHSDITDFNAEVITLISANETSHADVLVDSDFGTPGIMKTDGTGVYTTIADSSANWNTAYSWGNHTGMYLLDTTDTFTGTLTIDGILSFPDNDVLRFGTGSDWRHWYDGANNIMYQRGYTNSAKWYLTSDDSGGTVRNLIQADPNAGVKLYYIGSQKLETTTNGVSVTGTLAASSAVTVNSKPVFHEGDEDWQTSTSTTPAMNIHTSRNMELKPATSATTLSISNAHDGMSGIVVIDSSIDGTLTLPGTSHPTTILYGSSYRVIAAFVLYDGTDYIWQWSSFPNAPV